METLLRMFQTIFTQRFQPLETKKREISARLNAIIANVWGTDQVKNREIIENVSKILPGDAW